MNCSIQSQPKTLANHHMSKQFSSINQDETSTGTFHLHKSNIGSHSIVKTTISHTIEHRFECYTLDWFDFVDISHYFETNNCSQHNHTHTHTCCTVCVRHIQTLVNAKATCSVDRAQRLRANIVPFRIKLKQPHLSADETE